MKIGGTEARATRAMIIVPARMGQRHRFAPTVPVNLAGLMIKAATQSLHILHEL